MKKKVLTTAMALSMLAPTMTSFAATVDSETEMGAVSGIDTNEHSHHMKVKGMVRTSDGAAAEGRIEVSLPTSISFVVDQDGNVQTPTNISLENKSKCGVKVSIANFTDSTPKTGIVLMDSVDDANIRSQVNLSLSGDTADVTLKHGMAATELLTLDSGVTKSLVLQGQAGTAKDTIGAVDTEGVDDNFTLTLKVAKVQL